MAKLSTKFDEALAFAADTHRNQSRKGSSIPYITHPLAVCALVGEYGGDEDQMIAALLHDTVEDQDVAPDEIARRFGKRVAGIVVACTAPDKLPGGSSGAAGDAKATWKERKSRYLEHLALADADARLVAAADKLHNARSIRDDLRRVGPEVWRRFNAPTADVVEYYRRAAEVIHTGWQHPILADLVRVVQELEAQVTR